MTHTIHSSENEDTRDMNQLENEKAKKTLDDPGYDEFEDKDDVSKVIEIKDRESGSTVEESSRDNSNDVIFDTDENNTEYEE